MNRVIRTLKKGMISAQYSFIILTPLFLPQTLLAQHDSIQESKNWKIGFYAAASFVNGNFSELNESLIADGLPSLQETYSGVSMGISIRPSLLDKDPYFTLKVFAMSTGFSHTNANGASIRFFGIQNEWHRDLVKNNKWRIGPDFGFGAGSLKLLTYESLNSFQSFSANPFNIVQQEKELYSASLFLTGGLGIDRKIKIAKSNFYIGAGIGYRLSTPAKFHERYQSPYYDTPITQLSGLQGDIRLRLEL